MSLLYRRHSVMFRLASVLYFTPCSYNEKKGVFEETRRNLAAFGLCFTLAIPFWFTNIHLMATNYLRTFSSVQATVGGLELAIYASVLTCATLNVFVHRKRFTRLMNVLFRTDWLLDSFGELSFQRSYNENRVFGPIILFLVFGFCMKLSFHEDTPSKIISVFIVVRFLLTFLLAFVHRLFVRAIALRMEQLKALYQSRLFEQHVHYFPERFDRYQRQIEQIDRCFSFPVMLQLLLIMLQLLYILDEWFTMLTQVGGPRFEQEFTLIWVVRQIWQGMYGALGYITISACNETSKQVEETALCTRHFDDYRLQNTRAARQIQKFLLKNLHQKKKFSACGFFDIDNTVIYMVRMVMCKNVVSSLNSCRLYLLRILAKVFSSIVTYLVILIQFKQLETDLSDAPGAFNVTNNGTTTGPA